MAPLLSLLSCSTLAVLLASFSLTPVSALSVSRHDARMSPNHGELARRMSQHKRVKRCKPRTSVAPAPASTSTEAPKPTSSQPAQPAPAPPKTSDKPKPSDAPKPSSPPPSSGTNPWNLCPNKKMLAWGDSPDHLSFWSQFAKRLNTWGPTSNKDVAKYGVKACPMLWGEKDVQSFADKILNSDTPVDCAAGMNEPEIGSQANMSPERAAELWVQYIFPLKQKKGALLVSPAVTSDESNSLNWMKSFFKACSGQTGDKHCGADVLALHFYDRNADGFKSFVNTMHDNFPLPVMISEFADQNFNGGGQASMDEIWGFAGAVKSFLDNTDWIVCYSPFGAIPQSVLPDINPLNAIMGDNHMPTDLGYFYYS